jgi:UDP-N-acetylglucosamine 1-carboxyvinyltransferase
MDRIRIIGGVPLHGEISISGAKNAALPLMAACLLTGERVTLANLPHLVDISTLVNLLTSLGVAVSMDGDVARDGHVGRALALSAADLNGTTAPYDLVRKMRASILVLGPLVARNGRARVSLPGGCAIGTRPVDLHLDALAELGADIVLEGGYVEASAPKGLRGARIRFPKVSVGATENILMAATLAEGETVIENAAREPEIADLARCLVEMGATIAGIGSDRLVVQGCRELHGATYRVMPDRVEAGSFAVAAAITGGELVLRGIGTGELGSVIEVLERAGISVTTSDDALVVRREGTEIAAVDVTTQPFPGFPTDMQAQIMALLTLADGASLITETIFENRFMHVPELARMGADITVKGSAAMVRGVANLTGAPVMATDLRASVSLVLAGLAARGETVVNRVYHLDRGYERLVEKLAACGARIERLSDR